jgi:hypothetical protein
MDAGEFLITLWGDPPPGQVLIWTLPQKRSIWYQRLDNVRVGELSDSDVYTGVGVAPSDVLLKTGQRAATDTIAGIAGLWADVDYAGEDHAKPNLPPAEADAWELIDSMPAPATIVINSGHGLQAWWLFDGPWMFEDGEREEAQAMIRGWQGRMAKLAGERGWVVDATHDLARLMRLPGTFNNKSERVPVQVLSSDGMRLDREMIWDSIGIEEVGVFKTKEIPVATIGALVLDPDAEPPWEKREALRDNDRKFKKSTDRDRSDLVDQSASSYDMSLASIAVTAGWSDQEIVDLLIFQRRKNGEDLKLREDYYARTIAKAKGPAEQAEATERLKEGGRSLADLSALLGNGIDGDRIEILDLVMHVGDPPEFWMQTSAGDITLGTVNNITDQGRFLTAIAAATQLVLAPCKKIAWAFRAQAILRCCRHVELGEASHPGSEMAHWVETYLDTQTILEDQNIAAEQGLPFRKDGVVLFSLSGFRQYLRFSVGESLSSHKLGQRLRLCGIEPTVIRVIIKGKETSRNHWAYIGH